MSNEAFETPKHHTAVALSGEFADVVRAAAGRDNRSFEEQLVHWAIVGADCERIHKEKK